MKYHHTNDIKRPELNKSGSFYIIYSPEKFKLRPRDSIFLDLKLKLTVPKKFEVHMTLLPYLKEHCLSIENYAWELNKLKDSNIQLDILKKSFYNSTNIKKNQEISYIFILNQKYNENNVTLYNNTKWKINYHSRFLFYIFFPIKTNSLCPLFKISCKHSFCNLHLQHQQPTCLYSKKW